MQRLYAEFGFALLVASALAGCSDRPALPPMFSIDEIRYWWEDDTLVVNVTFTNQANVSAEASGFYPEINVRVREWRTTHYDRDAGEEAEFVVNGDDSIFLLFSPNQGDSWQKRWTRGTVTGPIVISPGETVQVEFELQPADRLVDNEGFYTLHIDLPSFYPRSMRENHDTPDAEYTTGCFNPTTPEFYGVRDNAPDCEYWDCTGEHTDAGWGKYRNRDELREELIPKCTATDAVGPYYEA